MIGRPPKYTVEEMVEAIHHAQGIVSHAATYLNCNRSTVEDYVKQHQEVKEALREERHAFVDLAEQKLREAVERREPWAVSLVLKTLGKERGYVETKEVNGTFDVDVRAPRLREVIIQLPQLSDAADDADGDDVLEAELLPRGWPGSETGTPLGTPENRETPQNTGPNASALQEFSAYTVKDSDDDDDDR